MKPSVGRIVHYIEPDWQHNPPHPGRCYAAIITHVIDANGPLDGYVDLTVFKPNGPVITGGIKYDPNKGLGESWHWPERVD